MRTTIELPEDLLELLRQLAVETDRSLSDVVADVIRDGLRRVPRSTPAGPPAMTQRSIGRSVTVDDVRSLEEDG